MQMMDAPVLSNTHKRRPTKPTVCLSFFLSFFTNNSIHAHAQIAVVDPSDAVGSEAFVERLREVGRAQRRLVGERFMLGMCACVGGCGWVVVVWGRGRGVCIMSCWGLSSSYLQVLVVYKNH
jgi:hypothetical protein